MQTTMISFFKISKCRFFGFSLLTVSLLFPLSGCVSSARFSQMQTYLIHEYRQLEDAYYVTYNELQLEREENEMLRTQLEDEDGYTSSSEKKSSTSKRTPTPAPPLPLDETGESEGDVLPPGELPDILNRQFPQAGYSGSRVPAIQKSTVRPAIRDRYVPAKNPPSRQPAKNPKQEMPFHPPVSPDLYGTFEQEFILENDNTPIMENPLLWRP